MAQCKEMWQAMSELTGMARARSRRIDEINTECDALERRLDALREERSALGMAQALDTYTCHCVNLNRKMEIHDSVEQERRNRNGLQVGLVSETLSASRSCPDCGGTGQPRGQSK
jgi:hypothetical protein